MRGGAGERAAAAFLLCAGAALALEPCAIEVVEKGSGWPVPLVELRTLHNVRFVTDNAGRIAFDLPELMGRETWFEVKGHGYGVPKDGFGFEGVRLVPEPGKKLLVEVERTIVARRIGRITGAGLLAESGKLGLAEDVRETGILGCDSVQNAVHRGRLFWMWGDTALPRYPLGIFHATGAWSAVDALAAPGPPLRLPLEPFTDKEGAPRAIAPIPGEGASWLTGLASLPDRTGEPRLVATYMKVRPDWDVHERGLAVWNEEKLEFERLRALWKKGAGKEPRLPDGHAVLFEGKVLFGNPFPALRCAATFEAWQDPAAWEALEPQALLRAADAKAAVKPHSGSIAWSPFRKRWVTVFVQSFGKPSALGEVWYAEADAPTGPWGAAVKVLSHDDYTFYNPRVHPEFTPGGSAALYFEGTYSKEFSGNRQPTPRYDYNQVLYRLDLDDPALAPAR
ncbi:MAG: DUF4185 domain-containing protein [Planctomycetes bacterium]|nr:DUF4185 domain-containing protein [Planctomycetota bacterium]